ncbi:hypothetical protein [Salinicola peritrichatus]|uniref:hypothetical protein n=1 Tax=Salinicola peritrichatus TaxID=1267424 RepID=UPI000DA221F2|nr:hypothetical protein [Salinicola peritrichatus]
MRKGLAAVTATTMLLLMGGVGFAHAQSDAMEEAYDANEEPMQSGSGVTDSGHDDMNSMDKETGHSDATDESLDSVKSETDEPTNVPDDQELDELNAEGQSDAAAEAQESQ